MTNTYYLVIYLASHKHYVSAIHSGEAVLCQTTQNALEFFSLSTAQDYMEDMVKNGMYEHGDIAVELP